jgi:Na+-driven multidrug efflux pump
MYLMLTNYVFFSKRTGLLSLASISSGALMLWLLPVFTKSHGITGAAMAFAAGMFVRFVLTWWLAQVRHPMPWFEFRSERLSGDTARAR